MGELTELLYFQISTYQVIRIYLKIEHLTSIFVQIGNKLGE